LSILLDIIDGFMEFNKVNDVRVGELSKDFDFLLQGLHVEAWMAVFDHFDGEVLIDGRIVSKLDPKRLERCFQWLL